MGYKQCIQRLPTSQLPSTWLAGLFGDAALGRRMAGGARVIILGSLVCLATAVDAACAVNADNGSSRRRLSASGDQPKNRAVRLCSEQLFWYRSSESMVAADLGLLGRWQKMVYRLEHTGCRAGDRACREAEFSSRAYGVDRSVVVVDTCRHARRSVVVLVRTTQWSGVWARLRRNPGRRSTACVPVRAAQCAPVQCDPSSWRQKTRRTAEL